MCFRVSGEQTKPRKVSIFLDLGLQWKKEMGKPPSCMLNIIKMIKQDPGIESVGDGETLNRECS